MAVLPLYFVRYIHVSTALIFRTLYSWLYEVFAVEYLNFFGPGAYFIVMKENF